NFTASGALTASGGGSLAVTGTLTTPSLSASSTSSVSANTLNTTGDVSITSSSATALVVNNLNSQNFYLANGTARHWASTSSTVSKLVMNVTSSTQDSGTLSATSMGYPANYSYGASGPSATLASISRAGGSHGGKGGYNSAATDVGAVFDDYHDPTLPGGGGS